MSTTSICAEPLRGFQPWCAPAGDGDVAAEIFGQRDEHQTNRPGADDQHVLSGAQLRVLDALHDAGQRLDERGVAEIGFRFEAQQIFLDEPRGNGDGFGVSAVEEQQIFAKIFLAGAAMKTTAARRGIGRRPRGRRFTKCLAIPHPACRPPSPRWAGRGMGRGAATSEMTPASSWPKTAGGTIILA